MNLSRFMADLHIHSTLSPCGSLDMSPRNIVSAAVKRGLDIIAVADHNSYENAYYTGVIAMKGGVNFLYGIEVQSIEEVHILAFFDSYEELRSFGSIIYDNLPDVSNNPDYFGDQVVVDEDDNIVKVEAKLLLNSTRLTLDEIVDLIKEYNGLAILSHVNAGYFSVISQLGFIPQNLSIDAVEVTCDISRSEINNVPGIGGRPIVTFSDAHYVGDIGRGYTVFFLKEVSVAEIKKALGNLEGRSYEVYGQKGRIL
ncbi:MAG TPA: PHP domain-containing protein [Candidatus Hydrothermia bacterium]|nr:PHP domain-containing protein [Candidatus Hydrothermia bacterium]